MDIKGISSHGFYGPTQLESLAAYALMVDLEFEGGKVVAPLVFSLGEVQELGNLKGLEALELFAEKLKMCFLGLSETIDERDN